MAEDLITVKGLEDAPMHPMVGLSAVALNFALKWHDMSLVKDGTMYQQYKLEGKNIQTIDLDDVFKTAEQFEKHLLQSPSRLSLAVLEEVHNELQDLNKKTVWTKVRVNLDKWLEDTDSKYVTQSVNAVIFCDIGEEFLVGEPRVYFPEGEGTISFIWPANREVVTAGIDQHGTFWVTRQDLGENKKVSAPHFTQEYLSTVFFPYILSIMTSTEVEMKESC